MDDSASSKPTMLPASATAQRDWKFEEVEEGWMWEHTTARGGVIAAGLFINLAQCIRHARSFGFVEAKWERRQTARTHRREQNFPLEHREAR